MLKSDALLGVMLNHDGEPYALKLGEKHYLVSSKPIRWYSRKTWWKDADSAPKGIGAGLIEVEMWRMWAACEDHQALFEIRHEVHTNSWQLVQINDK